MQYVIKARRPNGEVLYYSKLNALTALDWNIRVFATENAAWERLFLVENDLKGVELSVTEYQVY